MRHSAASLLLAAGVPPRAIMEFLGHSSITVTMNVYAHVMPAMIREAADTMDAVLAGGKCAKSRRFEGYWLSNVAVKPVRRGKNPW